MNQRGTKQSPADFDWREVLSAVDSRREVYRPCLAALAQGVFDEFVAGRRQVWELGAGLGTLARWLGPERLKHVVLTDPESRLVESIQERGFGRPVLQASAEHLDATSGSLDAVLALCVFDIVRDLSAVVAEISRVLRPGGRVVHLLDMTTNLTKPVADAFAGGLVPVPNVFFDPCVDAFPSDLVLLDGMTLKSLRRKLRSVGHHWERAFGDYCALYSKRPFSGQAAASTLRRLINHSEERTLFERLSREADQLAAQRGWARLSGTPASSARHFAERMTGAFADRGMRVLLCDVASTWDQVAQASEGAAANKPTCSYRSLAVGHERVFDSGGPQTYLNPSTPTSRPFTTTLEASMLVFVAEKPV